MAISSVTGGDKFKKALEDIGKRLGNNPKMKMGFFETATYPDGTPVASVAYANEFGDFKRPPRPFFRRMIIANKARWPLMVNAALRANNFDAKLSLEKLGNEMESELQQSIADLYDPPLSPVTVMLRYMRRLDKDLVVTPAVIAQARQNLIDGVQMGDTSTKPLVDTGQMISHKSIGTEIED